jgi:hypothetical protein
MKAKIGARATEVHKRPASAMLVEPEKLWPGYEVNVLDEFQGKTRMWTKIYYLFNGKPYTGWVAKDALDFGEPPWEDSFPPDVEKPIYSPAEYKFFRNPTEAIVTIAVTLGAIAFVLWAFV